MPRTKQYLRYEQSASFGVVCGRKANVLFQTQPAGGKRRALVIAPAAEDLLVWDLRKGEKAAVLRGRGEVSCVSESSDGGLLAAGCEDGSVQLWSSSSGEASLSFSGHKSAVTCLQFDRSGTRLVSGSKDTAVVVWDVAGGCGLFRLRGHKAPITACRWLHRGNTLITSSKDCLVKLWDLDTQHCFQTLVNHKSEVWGIEVVAMETRLVSVSNDRELLVFQLLREAEEREEGEGEGERVGDKRKDRERDGPAKVPVSCEVMGGLGRRGRERVVEMKTDSSGRLLGCLSARVLELYLVKSAGEREKVARRKRRKMQRKRAVEGDTCSLDEANLRLTAAEEMPSLSSISSRDNMRSFDLQPQPGNKMMAVLGLHSNSIELHMVDLETTPPGHTLLHRLSAPGHRTDVRAVCFSSDDSAIATGSAHLVKVWSRSSRHCLHTLQSEHVLSLTFVPGDRHIVAGTKSGHLQLFEVGSGDLLQEVQAHSGAVWSVDMSPDQRGLVTGSADHNVKFWDFELASDPKQRHLSLGLVRTLKMAEEVLGVRHSPDGRLLALALLDSTVKIFFTDSLKFFLSLYGHKLPVLAMDISSDSCLLVTCSSDKNIRIWGLDFGDCHKSIFAHDESVTCVKFVPETHLIFSCGRDRVVKCWDADSFDHVMTLEGHCGEVWCLAVSRDGDSVVTGSHDHSLRLWEKTEEPLILSEEREKEREALFEEAVAEGETVVPGEEGEGEVVKAGRKTLESMRAAEQLMEALAIYREETVKVQEWEEECRVERREVPRPKPHPLLVAMGDIAAERHALTVAKKIKSSELEEALLVMPFSDVTDFLPLLSCWLERGWETELACRCLLFLMRVHHHQITTSHLLLPVVDSLRQRTREAVEGLRSLSPDLFYLPPDEPLMKWLSDYHCFEPAFLPLNWPSLTLTPVHLNTLQRIVANLALSPFQDLYGFNLAGLRSILHGLETAGTPVFADISTRLQQIQKKRVKTV